MSNACIAIVTTLHGQTNHAAIVTVVCMQVKFMIVDNLFLMQIVAKWGEEYNRGK